MVWDEAQVAQRRIKQQIRTHATATMVAVISGQGGKEAGKLFKTFMEQFDDGED